MPTADFPTALTTTSATEGATPFAYLKERTARLETRRHQKVCKRGGPFRATLVSRSENGSAGRIWPSVMDAAPCRWAASARAYVRHTPKVESQM